MSEDHEATPDFLRVAQELLRAAVFEGRPPGTTGRVLGFTGSHADGRAVSISRGAELWELRVAEGNPESMPLEEILRLLGEGSLRLDAATVVPDIADYLFKHAVAQAEESLGKYLESERELALLEASGDEGDEAIRFTLHAGALDRSVARAVTSIILAIAAAEAQLNKWAEERGGWRKRGRQDEDRLPPHEKCRVLAARQGMKISMDDAPWAGLREAVWLRNRIVHSKPAREVVSLSSEARHVPGYEQSLEARRASWAVRRALVTLARILETGPPDYLAYCPPDPPEDDDVWRNASIMTGMREDPDFPPVSQRLRSMDQGRNETERK